MSYSDANLQLEQLHVYIDARKSGLCSKLRLREHRKCESPNNEANSQNTQRHSMHKPKEKWLLWCARLQSLAANCKCFSGCACEVREHIVKMIKKLSKNNADQCCIVFGWQHVF
jgi:hypothetical protein